MTRKVSTKKTKNTTFQLRIQEQRLQLFKHFAQQEGIAAAEFLNANINRFIAEHLPDKETAAKVIESNAELGPAVLDAIRSRQELVDDIIGSIIQRSGNSDAIDMYAMTSIQGADLVPIASGQPIELSEYANIKRALHFWNLDDLASWPDLQEKAAEVINEFDTHGYSHLLKKLYLESSKNSATIQETQSEVDKYLAALKKL